MFPSLSSGRHLHRPSFSRDNLIGGHVSEKRLGMASGFRTAVSRQCPFQGCRDVSLP